VQLLFVLPSFFAELSLSPEHWHRRGASTHERRLVCSPLQNSIAMSVFASFGVHVEGGEVTP
jgi:hypothetical protein